MTGCDGFWTAHALKDDGAQLKAHTIVTSISVVERCQYVAAVNMYDVGGELADDRSIICTTALAPPMDLIDIDSI